MERDELIIRIYLCIEEIYDELTAERPLRRGGFPPALGDVEVLTMEILGEIEGKNGDRAIWRYFKTHWKGWFPRLGGYKSFAKQCANLCWIKQAILARLFPPRADLHIVDGVPLPICRKTRAGRSRMLRDIAAWGYCAAKEEYYWGLKGLFVIDADGHVTARTILPANCDERQGLWDFASIINGMMIGDKGFIGAGLAAEMAEHGINLQTPLRDNMADPRPQWAVRTLSRVRKRVETAIGLLTEQFNITRIKAHDTWHYASKLARKLLAYNFYLDLLQKS
jgi:hypothetical protein